jgi:uncharacterized protein
MPIFDHSESSPEISELNSYTKFENSTSTLQFKYKMLRRGLRVPLTIGARHRFLYSTLPTEPPIMKELREDLKEAMRSKETTRKDALRSVMAAVKNANIEKAGSVISDLSLYDLVSSSVAKRQKTVEEYAAAKRDDLVEKEQKEIAVLEQFLTKISVATDDQVSAKVLELAKTLGVEISDPNAKKVLMSKIPWKEVETGWNASRKTVTKSVMTLTSKRGYATLGATKIMYNRGYSRSFSTCRIIEQHENPLVGI